MTPDEELKILRADWAALVAQVSGGEGANLRRGETHPNSGGIAMSRDDIIRMAREAGFVDASFCRWSAYTDDLERFAALVAALSARRGESACPHIRSSGPADRATHWCALAATPPAAPEPEPVAWLYQHGETGRTRIVMPDQVFTNGPNQWLMVGPLYQHPPAPLQPVAWLDEATDCAYTRAELDGGSEQGMRPLYAAPRAKGTT